LENDFLKTKSDCEVDRGIKFMIGLPFDYCCWCSLGGNVYKNKKVGSTTYLFSLKLTNLTKPKLMKKNVLQMYSLEF